MPRTPAAGWIRVGLFALPVYGLLTAYATLKPQPDQVSDPDGWARFVSSTVLGAALGMATTGASLPTQPVGAALLAISGAWIAWAALRSQ